MIQKLENNMKRFIIAGKNKPYSIYCIRHNVHSPTVLSQYGQSQLVLSMYFLFAPLLSFHHPPHHMKFPTRKSQTMRWQDPGFPKVFCHLFHLGHIKFHVDRPSPRAAAVSQFSILWLLLTSCAPSYWFTCVFVSNIWRARLAEAWLVSPVSSNRDYKMVTSFFDLVGFIWCAARSIIYSVFDLPICLDCQSMSSLHISSLCSMCIRLTTRFTHLWACIQKRKYERSSLDSWPTPHFECVFHLWCLRCTCLRMTPVTDLSYI